MRAAAARAVERARVAAARVAAEGMARAAAARAVERARVAATRVAAEGMARAAAARAVERARVAAARVAAEGMARAAAARAVERARAAAARAAEAEATATYDAIQQLATAEHANFWASLAPELTQIGAQWTGWTMPSAARPTKSSCPRHVSGNVWARQGCWERAMRFGPDCMPKPKQSGLQVECTKITARARWAFEATGKRICVRIDRHCAPETAPDIAALAMSAGASKIGIAIGMSSSSLPGPCGVPTG